MRRPTFLLLTALAGLVNAEPAVFTLVIDRQVVLPNAVAQVTVNGTVPGPALHVLPNQTVIVRVINLVPHEATTVHWHGMFQRLTPYADGVPGATQCAISNQAGHNSMTYTFQVPDVPGTFWYQCVPLLRLHTTTTTDA
jgi:laccase